jgi:hypothetical protein
MVGIFFAVAPTNAPIQPRIAPLIKNQRRPKISASLPLTVTTTAATRFHLGQQVSLDHVADQMTKGNSRNSDPDIILVWSYVGIDKGQDCRWHHECEEIGIILKTERLRMGMLAGQVSGRILAWGKSVVNLQI